MEKSYFDKLALITASHKRRIREINRSHNALKSYSRNLTIDLHDARRVPTYIAK
jgi:hypothetical protein